MKSGSTRYLWEGMCGSNVRIEEAAEFWRHKSLIPKIMYFAAIAVPKKNINLMDGVCFEPVLQEVEAKRNSVRRKSGNVPLQPISMDRAKFNYFIIKV